MNPTLQRYATPFVTGLFLVSLVSGVALFFHVGGRAFHGMHEWLSMVLILPFVLHLWKNWRPMTIYFRQLAFAVAMALSTLAALGFVVASMGASGQQGGPPQMAVFRALKAATPTALAPAMGTDAQAIVAALKARGFDAAASDVPLAEIATRAGKDDGALARALAGVKR
jgi:hypothetical protein